MTEDFQSQDAQVAPEVRVFTESEVQERLNDVAAKTRAEERAKREAINNELLQLRSKTASAEPTNTGLREEDVARIVDRQVQERAIQAKVQSEAQDFVAKLEAAKDKYPDMKEKLEELDIMNMPAEIWQNANRLDNTADVIYALGKLSDEDPTQYAKVLLTVRETPTKVGKALRLIADSVKQNENAKNIKTPGAPLSQSKPSISGTGDGSMSVQDWQRYWYKKGR